MTSALADYALDLLPPEDRSVAESLALLDGPARDEALAEITESQARALAWDWGFWARPEQRQPTRFSTLDAVVWFILAGRGYGKTRTGAETTREKVEDTPRLALIGPTAGDVRDVMVEGETGIMSVFPTHQRPNYEPSKRRITFHTGSVATTFSADEPDRLRGPQHGFIWGDEPASWRYGEEAWDNAEFGLRIGRHPQALLTGTPRPLKWLMDLAAHPTTVVTRGNSFRNLANLSPNFIARILERYEGTRLGLQEIHAQFLTEVEGALWAVDRLTESRLTARWDADGYLILPEMARIVVAVDPSGTRTGDECGIVVCSIDADGIGYVLDDQSLQGSPNEWAARVVETYHDWGADRVVAETNFGADLVETVLSTHDPNLPFEKVNARAGKQSRAEPVAALWEKHPPRVKILGTLGKLEQELVQTSFAENEASPNRLDAMVYGISDLFGFKMGTKIKVLG